MPTAITPSGPFYSATTNFNGPTDGEAANASSVNTPFGVISNSLEAQRLQTRGGGIRRRVLCTGNTSLTVYPLGAVAVTENTAWGVFAHNTASVLSPASLTGGLVADQRYWVYAFNDGGALGFTASTTGPDDGLRYKNGDTDFFYVTTFITDNAGNVCKYRQNDSEYEYLVNTIDGPMVTPHGNLIWSRAADGTDVRTTYDFAAPTQATRISVFTVTIPVMGSAWTHISDVNARQATIPTVTGINTMWCGEMVCGDGTARKLAYTLPNSGDVISVWIVGFLL